ncbi:MAG: hypothetical protein AAGF97_14485 [Planctomycetota bacterium]
MNAELKSRNGRLWLVLGLLACLQSGCAMCANDYDCYYPAYGGSVPREDMVCGRVNSIIRPASRFGGPPVREDQLERDVPRDPVYREDDVISAPGEGSTAFESEMPYDLGGESAFVDETMPTDVQPMNFEVEEERSDFDGESWDEVGVSASSDEGYDDEPVAIYEPDYGYDEIAGDAPAELDPVEQVDWDAAYPSPEASPEPSPLSVSQNVTPIGSGVAPNKLRMPRARTLRDERPEPFPTSAVSMPTSSASSPSEAYIDRLRPLSQPPTLGAPSEMPRY